MNDLTAIYYTDNTLEPAFEKRIQDELVKAAEGKRIISVSQKPMDFGDNICVGDIGRSHHSLFYQTLVGARACETKYMALAEHDCMYTAEHFNWRPPDDNIFWYNVNHWFVQWNSKLAGQYSYFRRKPMSQLICAVDIYIDAIQEKMRMLEAGYDIQKGQPGACEPGVCDNRKAFLAAKAKLKDVGKQTQWKAQAFRTELPNLDIRHKGNFSGARRARQRAYSIPYWGSFHAVMNQPPPGLWYQEATINDVAMPTRRKHDTNRRRWKTLIEPLLPFDDGTDRIFVELGCNAGFYLRKARDRGYKTIGIEKEVEFIRHAHYWETCDPKGVQIVEGDLNEYEFPAAQVLLMANVHYWLEPEQLRALLAKMRQRVLYCIVVGRHRTLSVHKSPCGLENLKKIFGENGMGRSTRRGKAYKKLFKGFEVERVIRGGKHYSVLFKNPNLCERNVDDIFHHQQLAKSKRFLPSYHRLIQDILSGNGHDPHESEYWQYLRWRKFGNSEQLLQRHIRLVHTMKERGMLLPLQLEGENRVVDGDHRLIVARSLGMERVICLW